MLFKGTDKNSTDLLGGVLSAGKLGLLIVVLSVLLAAGYLIHSSYNDVKQVHSNTTQVIRDQQLRRSTVSSMSAASRERSLLLLEMAYEDDPFVLDELGQKFSEQARIFLKARDKLLSLPLTDKERDLMDRHFQLTTKIAPMQDQVVEYFVIGEREKALRLLFDEAIPGQVIVFKQLSLILDEYNKKSMAFIENMDKEYKDNTHDYILLGGLLLVIGTITIFIMLTRVSRKEEKQLSLALDELAEHKYALDQHALVVVTDVKGDITYANDLFCNLSGYSKEEILGKNHRLLNSGNKDKEYWKEMYQTLIRGEVWRDIICNRAKDGRLYWVDSTMMPLMGVDKKPRAYISIRSDITELMQAEKALRRTQKMDALGQLTGGIAHDFNNLLNIILGNLELLQMQLPDDEKINKRIDNISKSSNRAVELTRQLLSFSRHHAENVTVTNINQLIMEMDSLVSHSVTPQVEIDWRLAEDVWSVEIAPGDFEDALLNLVINARDAMSGSGQLTIETGNINIDKELRAHHTDIVPGEYVQLIISDSGMGMTQDQLEHIYEPFYTTKEQGKGTGLGLAMVFGFIQRSNGYITVESEPGHGSSFQLFLPKAICQQSTETIEHDKSASNTYQGCEAVLLVDDEEALLELAKESLLNLGYKVYTANNGQQALAELASHTDIEMLISDVIMPGGMNGYELAERASIDYPDLKVLLVSGYTEKTAESKKSRFNINLLAKPYSQQVLAQKVREAFDS